jgi:thioredoxin 1
MFTPIYERVSHHRPDITFGKVDTEAEPALSQAGRISSIPTLMAFRGGVLVSPSPVRYPSVPSSR